MSLYSALAKASQSIFNEKKYEKLVSSEDVYDATAACPACGDTRKRLPVCKIQSDPLVEFLHCENCKGNSASLMPTDAYLASYYSNYYSGSDKEVTFTGKIERFADHICKYMKFDAGKEIVTIMDFGGGDGSIAIQIGKSILAKNKQLKKIKILLVDFQLQKGFDDGTIEFVSVAGLDEVTHPYDVVFASAIIEHIPKINETMQQIFKLVADGGYFYARVPYIMPFKKIFKSMPMLYPMHVHDFGPSFWNRIIERYKLNAVVIASQPPLPETEYKERFLYTLLGHIFKIPAYIDIKLRNPKDLVWNYVAGWEYLMQKNK